MTFAWFTFVAGIVVGGVIGYFVASSRLETKFIKGISSLNNELGDLKGELQSLKQALLRSEEERDKLARFNVLVPEIIRKLTTSVSVQDIPYIAVRSVKNFFNAKIVAFFIQETEDTFVLFMGTGYQEELHGSIRVKIGEGIVGVAIEHRKTMSIEDYSEIERHSRVSISEFEKKGLRAELVAPIIGVDGIYGAIAVADISFRVPEEKRYFSMIGDIIGLSYDKAKLIFEAEFKEAKDDICDIYSKGYFARRFVSELRKAENYLLPLSLLLLDIDNLKDINQQYGRKAGDVVIKSIAEVAKNKTRKSDFVARFEGDRFVIVMIASTKEQAYVHGNRLCNTIGSMKFSLPGVDEDLRMTVSGGVASYHIDGDQPSDLIKAAESSLVEAKSRGGNRVVKSVPGPGSSYE